MKNSFYFRKYWKKLKFSSIFFVLFILFLLCSFQSIVIALTYNNTIKNINTENLDCKQFIINFKDSPVLIYNNYLNDKMRNLFGGLMGRLHFDDQDLQHRLKHGGMSIF